MQPVLETRNLSKSFYGIAAVTDVSISIQPGQILGLIGQNGAGKSTLMNLIGGVIQPDSGGMFLYGKPYQPANPAAANRHRIAFIHQELNLFTNMTIAENIFIQGFPTIRYGPFRFVDWAIVKEKTRAVLDEVGLKLSPDTVVDRISPGERQLVEIARALFMDAALIIFDEPTTSLTARETENLFTLMRRLREGGKSIIYISHILKDILHLADSVAIMRDGALVTQEEASAFDINRMISLMVGRTIDNLYPPRTSGPTTTPLMVLDGVSAAGLVENVSFTLHEGEVLGLFGLMGAGRTELARIIFGLDSLEQGHIEINGKRLARQNARDSIRSQLAFVTENRREEGLLMNINISDNTALVNLPHYGRSLLGSIDSGRMISDTQAIVNALQLKSGDIRVQTVKALSGGNQQKVVMAKWLLTQPRVFILDEPTRGIDVGAKYEIYSIIDQLAASGSGVLFISSELEELTGMCDRILVMSRGEIFGEFSRGNYDEESILRAAFHQEEVPAELAHPVEVSTP
jgi:ABC-type sugar transport system ATPase subunit